jgi:hypothetical protein
MVAAKMPFDKKNSNIFCLFLGFVTKATAGLHNKTF